MFFGRICIKASVEIEKTLSSSILQSLPKYFIFIEIGISATVLGIQKFQCDFIKEPTLNVQVGRQTPAIIIIIIIIIIFQIIIILIQQRRIIVRGSPMGGFFQSKIDGIFQGN